MWSPIKTTPVAETRQQAEASHLKIRLASTWDAVPADSNATALPKAALPKAVAPKRSLRKAAEAFARQLQTLVCAVLLGATLALQPPAGGEAARAAGTGYCCAPGLTRSCPKGYQVAGPAPAASVFQMQCPAGSAFVCQLLDNPPPKVRTCPAALEEPPPPPASTSETVPPPHFY